MAGENLFSLAVSPAYQGRVLAQFAATDLKVKHVAVLADSAAAVSGELSAGFVQEFRKTKDARVDELSYGKEADFPDLVKGIAKSQPAAILVAGKASDLLKIRGQLHEAKVTAPLLFGAAEGSWPKLAEDGSEGGDIYASTVFATDGLTAAGREVAGKYRKRFDQDLDVHAAQAYDSIRLLAEALRRAKTTLGTRWREELVRLDDFESLTGPLQGFDRDHNARRPVFILHREGKQVKLARKFDPEPK
jgi:branched-chain amino acid transport system substrate-binding protein